MLDLSIVIVSFNTKDFLRNCLKSLRDNISKKITYEVVVADNDSRDGSAEMVKREFPEVELVAINKNLGFSKANNVGIKASGNSRYVLFLNSDTLMKKDTMEEMVKFMDEHEDVGASTCKLNMANGEIDDATHRGFPTPWNSFCYFIGLSKIFPKSKLFSGYNLGWENLEKTHEIDALAGAFMLVRRNAGEQANWWDEDYFFYGEDLDFCYILKQNGWKIYYVPTVSIIHFKGVSGGIKKISQKITTASEDTRERVTKWRFEAMRIFYKKHYQQKYPWIINFLTNLGISVRERLA